jgi:bifunctional NMN adenylyltransferase/nudix hydrolase
MNYDLAVFIGRFSIFHNGHYAVVKKALEQSQNVLILIGSANQPRSHRNPFTFDERKQMVLDCFPEYLDRMFVLPIQDTRYNDTKWVENIQKAVAETVTKINITKTNKSPKASIALIGHKKDHTSYYLKLFPQWDSIPVENFYGLSSTPMRETYFSNIGHLWVKNADGHVEGGNQKEHLIPTPVKNFLEQFIDTPGYKYVREEYEFVTKYKIQWQNVPYPVIFTTVDSIVIQSANILLVKRKESPGRGLWALPGGFINQDETLEKAMLRELKEETKIKVPNAVLRGSIVTSRAFDDPNRSARGRTITYGYLIKLNDELELSGIKKSNSEVEGGDDAAEAKWFPLAELDSNNMFEDHFEIIEYMKAYI